MEEWKLRQEEARRRLGRRYSHPAGGPSIPMTMEQRRIANLASTAPDPMAVITHGLCENDEVFFEWLSLEQLGLNGCQISVKRRGRLLRWASGGFGRGGWGVHLFTPYLNSQTFVMEFANLLAVSCGFRFELHEERQIIRRFILVSQESENRRIIPGDTVSLKASGTSLEIHRAQGTVDMNLSKFAKDGLILRCPIGFVGYPHHLPAIVRILAEANGLLSRPVDVGTFEIVLRSS